MTDKIAFLRRRAYKLQRGICYYCDLPVWEGNPEMFCQKFRITAKQAKALRSTAEHLVARIDGGKDAVCNIVSACQFCNQTRHKAKHPLSPQAYRAYVQRRIVQNRWHDHALLRQLQHGMGLIYDKPRKC